jgi:hypothetical protein
VILKPAVAKGGRKWSRRQRQIERGETLLAAMAVRELPAEPLWRVIWRGESEGEEQTKQPRVRPTDTGCTEVYARQYKRGTEGEEAVLEERKSGVAEVGAEKVKK